MQVNPRIVEPHLTLSYCLLSFYIVVPVIGYPEQRKVALDLDFNSIRLQTSYRGCFYLYIFDGYLVHQKISHLPCLE